MATTLELLHFSTLTETVNRVKSPNQFIRKLLFGDHRTVPTRAIEIGVLKGNREVAPFVKRGAAALMVSGNDETFQTVSPAHIRIKRAASPELMDRRRPGMDIFSNQGAIEAAIQRAYLEDAQRLGDLITNAEEYLCALALRGTITYTAAGEENFTITFPRTSSHNITLSGADLFTATTTSNPAALALRANRLVNEDEGLNITDAIMDGTTADLFVQSAKVLQHLENRPNLNAGELEIQHRFQEDGARLIGTYGGIRWWEYSRSVLLPDGTTAPLIRPKYVEFVTAQSAAENRLYYGAIEDLDALGEGLWVGERFSKSWVEKDPSARLLLATSCPLPVTRKPDTFVSAQVIA